MKFRIISALTTAFLILVSCDDSVRVDLDIKDADDYCMVYVPQASNSPVEKIFSREDDAPSVLINAYLGGPKTASTTITAEFEIREDMVAIFNEKNSKNYPCVPAECCSIDNPVATIAPGEVRSTDVVINIDGSGLVGNKTYILPVALKNCSIEYVREDVTVAYYLITITEEIPEDPRILVLDLKAKVNGRLFCAGSDLLFRNDDKEYNVYLYARNSNGVFEYESQPAEGWYAGGVLDPLIFIPPYTICFRLNDTFQEYSFFDRYTAWNGAMISWAGWGSFKDIFGFKDITFLAINGDQLMHYDIIRAEGYETNHWVIIDESEGHCGVLAESGFGDYRIHFCHKNNIVAVGNDGNLYKWSLSDELELGERVLVSEGWADYEQVFSCNDEYILALDGTGKLYRMPDEL